MDDDSTSEFGALIIEAGASRNLAKLKTIKRRVNDDREFRRICDVYSDFSTGRNVLHHAAEIGHFEICKFLIQNVKVHINASTYRRDTPLLEAAKGEHVKLVEYLINKGAIVGLANSQGFTALHYAIQKDNMELTKLLLINDALIEADSVDGTPLQCAASRGNVEAVELLLTRGAKPDLCHLFMASPLVCAIKSRSFECLELLLKAKADPNTYFIGSSPLSYAAKEGDTRFLKSLLKAKANPNSPMTGHLRPIEEAALAGNREGVEILCPLTAQVKHYPNWTVDGIMEYCHTEEAKKETEELRSLFFAGMDETGHAAMRLKDFDHAVVYFRMANNLDPSNPKWASKRSLCHAHAGRRMHALLDAEECLKLEPRFPIPHVGDPVAAAQIFEKFFLAAHAFTMAPHGRVTDEAFRVAFFDYFAWLYLMSSPEEILSLSKQA